MKIVEEYGVDNRNNKPPVRRKRMRKETWQIDRDAKSKNEERRKAYREFTRVRGLSVLLRVLLIRHEFLCKTSNEEKVFFFFIIHALISVGRVSKFPTFMVKYTRILLLI